MTLDRLASDIGAGEEVLLDSSALIVYFGAEPTTPVVVQLLDDWVFSGRNRAAVSAVSVMELSVRPFRVGGGAVSAVTDFLSTFPNLRVLDVDMDAGLLAGKLRADVGLSPPDALIVGCAARAGIRHLVSNDARWASRLPALGFVVTVVDDYLPFP